MIRIKSIETKHWSVTTLIILLSYFLQSMCVNDHYYNNPSCVFYFMASFIGIFIIFYLYKWERKTNRHDCPVSGTYGFFYVIMQIACICKIISYLLK